MIKFACPGCSATFTVADEKAGKTGKCPKCSAQFIIPDLEVSAASSPPQPPPPPAPAPDPSEIEIKPCPGCQAKLVVATSDLGSDVECPYCKTVYTAVKPGSQAEVRVERKSRRSDDDEDDDDRPKRRSRREEEDDDDDRPRKRSRRDDDDEDDEDDDRPRKRKRSRRVQKSGAVTVVGIMNFVLGGLGFICSCGIFAFTGLLNEAVARNPNGRGNAPIDPNGMAAVLWILGGIYVLISILLVTAGFGVIYRKTFGRILTFATAGIALLMALLCIGSLVMNVIAVNLGGIIGALIGLLIWGFYGGYSMMTMIKNGDEFA